MKITVSKAEKGLSGEITIPADKSVAHRAVILSSLAKGKSVIKNFSKGADPLSTLNLCHALGINSEYKNNDLIIYSNGLHKPSIRLNCGNSGTTMRLMSGVLAGQKFNCELIGDESLSKRPMKRIIKPLTLMGARICADNNHAPLKISGRDLYGIDYKSEISSAQVKSCILLAGINAEGKTTYTEPYISRDHTERMLKYMGANISISKNITTVEKSELTPKTIEITGDISSAAYFIAAALIVPDSNIILKNIGLNPTRTGIIDVVKKMGADIKIINQTTVCNEETGDIQIKTSQLEGIVINEDIIPRLIDEIPIIAVIAAQASGETIIRGAEDLRNKESDRIKNIVSELKKLGAEIEELDDGLIISGNKKLIGGAEVESFHDHRLAMSLYIAGLVCEKEISINGFEWTKISFPEFLCLFDYLKNS